MGDVTPPLAEALPAIMGELDLLPANLARDADARAVVFIRSLASFVADQAADGTLMQASIQDWTDHARGVLDVFKVNRRKMLLIDLDEAIGKPELALATARAWQHDDDLPEPDTSDRPDPDFNTIVLQLAAFSASQSHGEAVHLQAELDAASAPLGFRPLHPGQALAESVAAAVIAAPADTASDSAAELKDTLRLASLNYAEVLGEAESLGHALGAICQALELPDAGPEDAVEAVIQCRETLAISEAERERLTQDRTALQEQLGAARREISDIGRAKRRMQAMLDANAVEINDLHTTQADLRRVLDAVRGSTSWRVTAPIRALRDGLKGSKGSSEKKK